MPSPQIHLLFGSAIHEAIENFDKDPKEIFRKKFSKGLLEETEYPKYDELLPVGERMVEVYLENKKFYDDLFDLEKGETEIWVDELLVNPITKEELPIRMKGRIDKLTESGRIIDYKTASQFYNEEEEGFKLQTRLYDLAYFAKNGVQSNGILYFVFPKNLKSLNSSKPIQVIEIKNSLDDLAETFESVKALLDEINQGDFKTNQKHGFFCECKKLDKLLLL